MDKETLEDEYYKCNDKEIIYIGIITVNISKLKISNQKSFAYKKNDYKITNHLKKSIATILGQNKQFCKIM